jgi:hypothetical protein
MKEKERRKGLYHCSKKEEKVNIGKKRKNSARMTMLRFVAIPNLTRGGVDMEFLVCKNTKP